VTNCIILGSCLSNLQATWLMADYKWERLSNAVVERSDFFVDTLIDKTVIVPPKEQILSKIVWNKGAERNGLELLKGLYFETAGLFEMPAQNPPLFTVLREKKVDWILLDNLHDTNAALTYCRLSPDEPPTKLTFSMSLCSNEAELIDAGWHYGQPIEPAHSADSWCRIFAFLRKAQPDARMVFTCHPTCTLVGDPAAVARANAFVPLLLDRAAVFGVTVIQPLSLAMNLTRLPEDWSHLDMRVYRALAGRIFMADVAGLAL
jgi:hypothetical protein